MSSSRAPLSIGARSLTRASRASTPSIESITVATASHKNATLRLPFMTFDERDVGDERAARRKGMNQPRHGGIPATLRPCTPEPLKP